VRTEVYVNEAELWGKHDTGLLSEENIAAPEENHQPDKNICILSVDDNADMRTYLSRILNPYRQVEIRKEWCGSPCGRPTQRARSDFKRCDDAQHEWFGAPF
jgi:hypothetical protein